MDLLVVLQSNFWLISNFFYKKYFRVLINRRTILLNSYHWSKGDKLSLAQEVFIFELLAILQSYFNLKTTAEATQNVDLIFYYIFYCRRSYYNSYFSVPVKRLCVFNGCILIYYIHLFSNNNLQSENNYNMKSKDHCDL